MDYQCKYCSTVFTKRQNRSRHEKKYCHKKPINKIKVDIKLKDSIKETQSQSQTQSQNQIEIDIDIDREFKKDIMKELNILREKVYKLENSPRTTHVNVNLQNCIIIGDNVYDELVNKLGHNEAINYLTSGCYDEVDVIEKLYLDSPNPNNYPIACKTPTHFRYLNEYREIIDDQNGNKVQKLVKSRVREAMLLAIMEEDADTNSNIHKLLTDDKRDILTKLAKITYNPDHPFFYQFDKIKQQKMIIDLN